MDATVEAVDVFEGGKLRVKAVAENGDTFVFNLPVRLHTDGSLLEDLPYAEGDKITVTVGKK